jgi:hypothetical protein
MVRTQKLRVVGNPGNILGFTLAGNPGRKKRKVGSMATAKKKGSAHYGPAVRKNSPSHKKSHHGHRKMSMVKRNVGGAGGVGSIGSTVTNALFVIAGALGSKLGAQAALGDNNVGLLGYFSNAVAGGLLWLGTSKLIKNKAASDGVIAGTVVQIILRAINDYTPFGSYVSQLGMGDYQVQSYLTPQVLVDPVHSAQIKQPAGWGYPMIAPAPVAAAASPSGQGMATKGKGVGGLYGGSGRGLY